MKTVAQWDKIMKEEECTETNDDDDVFENAKRSLQIMQAAAPLINEQEIPEECKKVHKHMCENDNAQAHSLRKVLQKIKES